MDEELRFGFGENWTRFLQGAGEEQADRATADMRAVLGGELAGRTVLDVGCGSGLHTLAALRLGAERVVAIDVDPLSAAACRGLLERAGADRSRWEVVEGSVLDEAFLCTLGVFDLVYAWGVLHHTGAMWDAISAASRRVAPGGLYWLALYNDQGWRSDLWRAVKVRYNRASPPTRSAMVGAAVAAFESRFILRSVLTGGRPWERYRGPDTRGMDIVTDWRDWIGGYPFEVVKPEDVHAWGRSNGFELVHLRTVGGAHGCNEYVLHRSGAARSDPDRLVELMARTDHE